MNYRTPVLIFFILIHVPSLPQIFTVIENGEYRGNCLSGELPESFVVRSFTISSDIVLQLAELRSLLPFIAGHETTCRALQRSFWYCVQKNKIEQCVLSYEIYPDNSIDFSCTITSFLTCGRIKIKGAVLRKAFYKSLYDLRTGDRFDQEKHQKSIRKIIQQCKDEGYFSVSVEADLTENPADKTMGIVLHLSKGSRFTISSCKMIFDGAWDEITQEEVRSYIEKKYVNQLQRRAYYEHTICDAIVADVKHFLLQQKGVHVAVEQKESFDEKKRSVLLEWHVAIIHTCSYIFVGNLSFATDQLIDLIVKFGKSVVLLPASIFAQEIERFYKSHGFWEITIEVQQDAGRYIFIITEGERTSIDTVCVKTREGKVITKSRSFFRPLIHQKFYNDSCLQSCCRRFLEKHQAEGFLGAAFVGHEYKKKADTEGYDLYLTFDEGKKRSITAVVIEGFPDLTKEGPFARFGRKKEFPIFSTETIDEQRQWLLRYFRNRGYIKTHVKPIVEEVSDEAVSLTWHINQGAQPTVFGPTIIEGISPLLYEYVSQICRYKSGDMWSEDCLRQTLLDLNDRDVFESVFITPGKEFDTDTERPVILRLCKDDPYEMRLRAGLELQHVQKYQTFSGLAYRVGASFIVKNPTDRGDRLSIDVDIARSHYELIGQYKKPFFIVVPWNMSAQLYATKYGQPAFIGSRDTIYTMWQRGFLVDIKRKHMPVEVGINGGLEWMKTAISDVSHKAQAYEIARAINFAPLLLGRSVPYIFFEPTLFIDFLDNKLNPRHGMLTVISAKGMIRIGSGDARGSFIRVIGQQSFFIPLGWITGALQFRVGHIFYASFSHIMPSERFYLGGSHSLRSYDTDLAPPLGVFINEDKKPQYVPRGGRSMVNITAEARIPLIKNIGGVVFGDGGVLSADNFADVRRDSWLGAIGIGLRFFTPIGPLRFDIGWSPFKKAPFERSYAWFLTFGQAF